MAERFDLVIIGGGILGISTAYHVVRMGAASVLVLERNQIASQATPRAAALLTQIRYKPSQLHMVQRTFAAIEELRAEQKDDFGLRRTGSLHVASTPATETPLRMHAEEAHRAGVEIAWIDANEAKQHTPWLDASSATAIALTPGDMIADPHLFTNAYATAARAHGAVVRTNTAVTGLVRRGSEVLGVKTATDEIHAGAVIDAAGAWAGLIAREAGVSLPMAPVWSHYWVAAPDAGFPPDMTYAILPDARAYVRPEVGGAIIGLRERKSLSLDPRALPDDVDGLVRNSDEEADAMLLEGAGPLRAYFPSLDTLHFVRFMAGLSAYTPDGEFVLGPVPGAARFFAAAGCCGSGIACSGGIGLGVAETALGRTPSFDLAPFRPDRFGAIDPFALAFRERCAASRSGKLSG
ncbi:MAG: NAD(P)/FAD-dependent oxidoreductase [Alphaproteobacteria bacterium]